MLGFIYILIRFAVGSIVLVTMVLGSLKAALTRMFQGNLPWMCDVGFSLFLKMKMADCFD